MRSYLVMAMKRKKKSKRNQNHFAPAEAAEGLGSPQCGQAFAFLLTSLPHSLQDTISLSSFFPLHIPQGHASETYTRRW